MYLRNLFLKKINVNFFLRGKLAQSTNQGHICP